MRGLLSVVEERRPVGFTLDRGWRISPNVALRDESFGALAYHYGNRRLVFLKSRRLVELVTSLERYDTAAAALHDLVPEAQWSAYERALAGLAASEVLDAR